MKIISWNVNGVRAWYKKGCFDEVLNFNPDIFCIQETKAEKDQLPEYLQNPKDYIAIFNSSLERKGHSGTAIYTKIKPEKITYGLGIEEFDKQGRQINIFWEKNSKKYALINCYFPNGGGGIEKLNFKLKYYEEFLNFIKKVQTSGYNVIFCGDVNVAHNEIDLARPDSNRNSVGFLREERDWIDNFIKNDFIDVFRFLNKDKTKYTWWDMKTFARNRNIGWRLDYFFVNKNLLEKVKNIEIFDNILGSDHCPVLLDIEI